LILPANNNTQPLVSIAICTYNGSVYLQEQLDSIISQTYKNLEILIVDDNSTDVTKEIILAYCQKDSRIIFFQNKSNLGYNKNFEKACHLCSGNYIAISDQDDIWEPNKIELMMNNWPAGSLLVYSLSGNFMDNNFAGRTAAPKVRYTNIDNILKLVFNSPVHGHAFMFKKELLHRCLPFPSDIFYDWWMSMHAADAATIGCIQHTLTWHRHHSKNSSRTLMTIRNKEERDKQLRSQMIHFIETFCAADISATQQKVSLLKYAGILKKMDGKKFSTEMFMYVIKNRKFIFHYKKNNAFALLSQLKQAVRMGYRGLL
jgi:glycosyltransferase involved in cell wall biosynthesis